MSFHRSVGPRDALFILAGWCFLERVGGQDFGGIRVPVPSTKDLEQLVELNRHLIALAKTNAQLQKAVDVLALPE